MRWGLLALTIALSFAAGFACAWISKPGAIANPAPVSPLPTETLTKVVTSATTVTRTISFPTTVTRLITVTSTRLSVATVGVAKTVTVTKPVSKVKLLIGSSYPREVLKLLERANRSVYVMMFAMKYYPREPWSYVDRVIDALCRDAKRGLDVRVLVDYVTLEEYREAVKHLEDCGVKVRVWRECDGIWKLHAKVVIVDGRYVVLGSHNWTYSAFEHNVEVSVEIASATLASRLANLFEKLWNSYCSYSP